MISMDQIHRIRDLYYGQDKSLTEIAKIENLDWRTVRKYVDMEDFNQTPQSPDGEEHSSKLDQFKPIIDKWLTDDRKARVSSGTLLEESISALKMKWMVMTALIVLLPPMLLREKRAPS